MAAGLPVFSTALGYSVYVILIFFIRTLVIYSSWKKIINNNACGWIYIISYYYNYKIFIL